MYYRYNGLFLDQSKSLDQLGVRNNSDLECSMNNANYPGRAGNCPYNDMDMDPYAVEIADYGKISTLETDTTVTPNHLYVSSLQLSSKNNTYRDTARSDDVPDFFVGKEDQLATCFDSKQRVYLYVQ
ncbi:hypothetical protein M3Y97_01129100 [Aphelenchoides bicaudatus]|nr:hypothetical protein M3Y97_01129100 [Aphelenchoides bicaudatus]